MYFSEKGEVDDFKAFMEELSNNPDSCNCGVHIYETLRTVDELQTYTNDGPLDWAAKPTGPKFWNLSEETYYEVLEQIKNGSVCICCSVDYGVCDIFEDRCSRNILTCEF
jgi:hypothetical protein